ncbi:Rieske (2Fe-2S) protein [Rhodovibrionaceae bacterium A322]
MSNWVEAATIESLPPGSRRIFKADGKQIALFNTDQGLFACNNRCPHEGYPLLEGSLESDSNGAANGSGCKLTCNWHAWTFDLTSGENAAGGDRLRLYPVQQEGERILVDISDPPEKERQAEALSNLKDCFQQNDRGRMARELARLQAAGGDPLEGVRQAITWTYDHFPYGMTHAYAAAADWLALRRSQASTPAEKLVPLMEAINHMNYDSLREEAYPFAVTQGKAEGPEALAQAIEDKDEGLACAIIRAALAGSNDRLETGLALLNGPLAQAALNHYGDFGHSAIYQLKTRQLLEALGEEMAEPLLFCLTRALIDAWREDLIPEFKAYHPALKAWRDPKTAPGNAPVSAEDFQELNVAQAVARCLESKDKPADLYTALLGAAGWNMLHFDLSVDQKTDNPVSHNKSWLSFTHAITFSNAARNIAERQPDLWPEVLLQMACFVGRNSSFLDLEVSQEDWQVSQPEQFLSRAKGSLFDHQQPEHIVAAHVIKVIFAVAEEVERAPDQASSAFLLAASNRFLNSPVKRPHVLRAAEQALAFVAREG